MDVVVSAIVHSCAYFTHTDPYKYDIYKGIPLKGYNLESQAEIIADYWPLKFRRNPSLLKKANLKNLSNRSLNTATKNFGNAIHFYETKVRKEIYRHQR